jgi:2-polyprenyl-6-methoxyphenol hydroxylase-like FAD-dependent oxidoreductase
VGVAFLWSDGQLDARPSIDALLGRFPLLGERLSGAEADSEPRGAGPFLQRARCRVSERFALLGDAGGYVDAITGEGLSVALVCAESLAARLPEVVRRQGDVRAFRPYVTTARREFRKYAWTARRSSDWRAARRCGRRWCRTWPADLAPSSGSWHGPWADPGCTVSAGLALDGSHQEEVDPRRPAPNPRAPSRCSRRIR